MSAWQVIKKSFKDFYKHLFLLGAVSLIWFLVVGSSAYVGLGGLALSQPWYVIIGLILIGPFSIGAYHFTNGLLKFQELGLFDYLRSILKLFLRGMLAFWLSLLIFIILGVDLVFFMNSGNKFFVLISGVWIYLLIFFTMSQFYFWSLLVESNEGIFKVLKKSVLLTLDNLLYSGIIFLAFAVLLVVCVVTAGVALAVSFIGFLGILANNATYNLLVKYNLRDELTSPYGVSQE